jgi:beta-galactosidase
MPGKPNTQQVLEGSGPLATPGGGADPGVEKALEVQICAAFNRHTILDSSQWLTPTAAWYNGAPSNYYALFWHKHSINGLAYGFSYDDAQNQSSSIIGNNVEHMVLGIGW